MGRKERTIFITIIANIILIVLRFFLAGLSGSIGLKANAWHSFTDVFVSSVVFIGLMTVRLGAKRWSGAVKKVENLLAIFVSFFIFRTLLLQKLNNFIFICRYMNRWSTFLVM